MYITKLNKMDIQINGNVTSQVEDDYVKHFCRATQCSNVIICASLMLISEMQGQIDR